MELFHQLLGVAMVEGYDLPIDSPSEIEGMHLYWGEDRTVLSGIQDPREGNIDPSRLPRRWHITRLPNGLTSHATPDGLAQHPSDHWTVDADRSTPITRNVINAAGASGEEIVELAGLHTPVETLIHEYRVKDALPELDEHQSMFP